MKILFLSETSAFSTVGSAQLHRLKKLHQGLEALGFEASFLSLRDMPISRPTLLFPFNLPFAWAKYLFLWLLHGMDSLMFIH